MRNYSPTPGAVSMYPLSSPQPRNAPPANQAMVYAPSAAPMPESYTYTTTYQTEYSPAYVRPATGVCWVVPPGRAVMPDPPSVTVNMSGAVVSSTPVGNLYPPAPGSYPQPAYQTAMPGMYSPPAYQPPAAEPYQPNPQATFSAYDQQPMYNSSAPPPVVPVPELPAPFRETATGSSFGPPAYAPANYASAAPPAQNTVYVPPVAAPTSAYPALYETVQPSAFAPQTGGMQLVRAYDIPSTRTGDAAPAQWFEIVRPGNGPLRIGRVSSSCVCVGVRVPNRFIAQGERALVEARVLSRPPADNLTYVISVGTIEPRESILTADVTIRL
ncbi:MAG: hypothetical protein LBT97_08840 [Planctomycetota bacterium]|nr:hypothetical protein [Planctomycetota bacterium]